MSSPPDPPTDPMLPTANHPKRRLVANVLGGLAIGVCLMTFALVIADNRRLAEQSRRLDRIERPTVKQQQKRLDRAIRALTPAQARRLLREIEKAARARRRTVARATAARRREVRRRQLRERFGEDPQDRTVRVPAAPRRPSPGTTNGAPQRTRRPGSSTPPPAASAPQAAPAAPAAPSSPPAAPARPLVDVQTPDQLQLPDVKVCSPIAALNCR